MINIEMVISKMAMELVKNYHNSVGDNGTEKQKMSKLEATLTATLDILRENGFGGAGLWLMEKYDKDNARKAVFDHMLKCINFEPFRLNLGQVVNRNNYFYKMERLTSDEFDRHDNLLRSGLDHTLFMRTILDKMLIYSRHWAKQYGALSSPGVQDDI